MKKSVKINGGEEREGGKRRVLRNRKKRPILFTTPFAGLQGDIWCTWPFSQRLRHVSHWHLPHCIGGKVLQCPSACLLRDIQVL